MFRREIPYCGDTQIHLKHTEAEINLLSAPEIYLYIFISVRLYLFICISVLVYVCMYVCVFAWFFATMLWLNKMNIKTELDLFRRFDRTSAWDIEWGPSLTVRRGVSSCSRRKWWSIVEASSELGTGIAIGHQGREQRQRGRLRAGREADCTGTCCWRQN